MAMAKRAVWLEAALNGPWLRSRQPRVPMTVDEIVADGIACARAGAAIIHVHARDPDTGVQRDDADLYTAIIEGIRAQVDAIVYPTIPLSGAPGHEVGDRIETRFAAVRALADRGLLEWCVVDPGSVNFLHADDLATGEDGFVYRNPAEHIRAGLDLCAESGAHPSFAVYEPGFVRVGAALAQAVPEVPQCIYRFMFSDDFRFGFPPRAYALEALLALLAEETNGSPWMLSGLAVDIMPLAVRAISEGGHLRVGLEDAPFGTQASNIELVEAGRSAIEASGERVASAEDVRCALRNSR